MSTSREPLSAVRVPPLRAATRLVPAVVHRTRTRRGRCVTFRCVDEQPRIIVSSSFRFFEATAGPGLRFEAQLSNETDSAIHGVVVEALMDGEVVFGVPPLRIPDRSQVRVGLAVPDRYVAGRADDPILGGDLSVRATLDDGSVFEVGRSTR